MTDAASVLLLVVYPYCFLSCLDCPNLLQWTKLDFFDFLELFRLIHGMDYLISAFPHPRMDGLPFTPHPRMDGLPFTTLVMQSCFVAF